MTSNAGFKQMIDLLKKPSNERNEKELHTLLSLLKDVHFFKERNILGSDLIEVGKELKYEVFDKDEYVFKAGEYGDKFFIILKGIVSVTIKTNI